MQTGTWSAIGFPITSINARRRFYEYANWCYQGGVFVSRSSGMIVRLSPLMLWSLPAIQVSEADWIDQKLKLMLCPFLD